MSSDSEIKQLWRVKKTIMEVRFKVNSPFYVILK